MVLLDGFKFGSFMQLAIGPLIFIVLNTSIQYGYISGLAFAGGEIIIDMLYMFFACIGVSKILQKKQTQTAMKIFGAIILIIFGVNIIISIFGKSIFPKINLKEYITTNLFIQGIVLTASNPLSIIFFTGIFTSKMIEKRYTQIDTFVFAVGCISARILFLLIVIFLGSLFSKYLQIQVLNILNFIVGMIIIYFGIKLFMKIRH